MKQAVILIHGIGEQEPMGTIRPFVEAVLQEKGVAGEYFSKPDAMSELFELRCLQATGRQSTHFYEYYWAYNVEGTKILAVVFWVLRLIGRKRADIPVGLRGLWWMSRALIVIAVLLLVSGALGIAEAWFSHQPKYGIIWLIVAAVAAVLQYILVFYLGDAARYLSPRPQNIKLRQQVRAEGVKLLRTLHESRKFDRIIIVGHSLGSVIGYDIITHLWQDYHGKLPELETNAVIQAEVLARLASGGGVQPVVRDELANAGGQLVSGAANEALNQFQTAQVKAWREQRYFGNPWRISDFVTMGSPLAHAMLLLAGGGDDFASRKKQRELVTCPPQPDKKGYAYSAPTPIELGPAKNLFTPLILHHGAPFAVTRWTNLYFPVRFGLFGDFIGGPHAPAFGPGIKDIAVSTKRWRGIAGLTLGAHISYWQKEDDHEAQPASEPTPALRALKDALDLNRLRAFTSTARFGSAAKMGAAAQ